MEVSENKPLHIPSTAGKIPKQWRWERLDDVCAGTFDCPHSTPVLTNEGPLVVRSQDVRSGVFRTEAAGRVSEETYVERIARAEPQYGDLIYSREGTYFGIAAEVPPKVRVCLGQRMVLLRPKDEQVHFRFLRYWLNSPVMASHIHGFRDGTVAERLNMPIIRGLPILLPPLSEQRAIASVLGALDDKIELNRRMNETLEALAQTRFKSWFVDATESALPKGWRNATISELCEINSWTLGKGDELDRIEYVEISEVMRGNIANIQAYERGEEPSRARRRLRHGDTVLSTVRPDRGAYFLCLNPSANLIGSTGFAVLTPTKAPWSFIHAAMTQPDIFEYLGQQADGGAYPAVRPEIIGALEVALPDKPEVLESFHRACAPLYERAELNRTESRTLAALRDALLPKLLSGELRVPTAAQLTEAIA
jgi:type I restriction enzyme S subunit